MYCSKCGHSLILNAQFCSRCGNPIALPNESMQTTNAEPASWMKFLAKIFGTRNEPTPSTEVSLPAVEPVPPPLIAGSLGTIASPSFPVTHDPPEKLPYRLSNKFLTRAEASFFRVLQLALPEGALLCPKVNLQDLFWAPPHDYTARNRIDRKHVDFVIADTESLQPLCGIELDDRSHARPDRQERDRFVEAVFASAGLPLVRVPVSAEYDPVQLAAGLKEAIAQMQNRTTAEHALRTTTSPACPKCRTTMVTRTTKHGPNVGHKFYGCPNYPRCHGMVSL